MVDARIAQRRRALRAERRRRRLRRTIVIVVVSVPILTLVWMDAVGRLAVASVHVEGTRSLTDEEVVSAAAIPQGASLIRLSTSDVTERVERIPRIASAEVRRTWSRQVVITVDERVQVLRASGTAAGRQREVLVDRDGVIIDVAGDTDDQLALILLSSLPPGPGATVDAHSALANAFEAWRALSGPLRAEVTTFIAEGEDRLELELRRGARIVFGRAERVDEKVRAIGAVLADLGEREVALIDVRAPSRPVVTVDTGSDSGDSGSSNGSGSDTDAGS